MSTPPKERETYTISLDREERWIVHAVLTDRLDDRLDDGESPPEWLLALVDGIEAGDETFTDRQVRSLSEALRAYASDDETPLRDVELAATVAARFGTVH